MSNKKRSEIDEPVGPLPSGGNRPDMVPREKDDVLFHDAGSTGWGRIRNIHGHKGNRSELDFGHKHGLFFDAAVDAPPDDAA